MSRAFRTLFVFFAAAASVAALGQAEDPQVRKEIRDVYARWDKLVAAGDAKGLGAMIHKSFVATDKSGKTTNAEQAKKMMSSMVKMFKEPKSKITIQNIQAQGDEVVAWVTMTVSFKQKQGEKWVANSFKSKFAETLKKFDGEWKFVASQELAEG